MENAQLEKEFYEWLKTNDYSQTCNDEPYVIYRKITDFSKTRYSEKELYNIWKINYKTK